MTKPEFIAALQAIYRVANVSDGDDRADWTVPEMAGKACCRHLDRMIGDLQDLRVLPLSFHDTI